MLNRHDSARTAFTLAEVLITLSIIGVVAALTMPALIGNYKKKQTVVHLQKAYSVLSQASKLSEADNGEPSGWTKNGAGKAALTEFLHKYYLPYFRVIKSCETDIADCGFAESKLLNGSGNDHINNDGTAYVLTDGTSILFTNFPSKNYIVMYLDVNGMKAPNTVGKDQFRFDLGFGDYVRQGLIMAGTGLTPITAETYDNFTRDILINGGDANGTPGYSCNTGGKGYYCGGLIMHDGWEIKDDYPW